MRKLFFKSMLLLCALIVGTSSAWGTDTYTKVTSAPDDWSGTYVIIADASSVVFIGQDGSNNYGGYAAVTIKDGTVTNDLSSYEVLVEKSGTSYTIKHIGSSKYLGWSSGNTLAFSTTTPSTNAYKWSLSPSSILNASDVSRKLQYNSTSPRFACYTSSQKVAYLYKKDEPISVTSLSVKSAPSKTRYEIGETLDMIGFVLDADGEDVSKGYTMSIGGDEIESGATLNSAGKKTITVSYGGKEVSQNISVGSVTSIAVTTPPTKTSYDTGDSFDPTGMVVTASLSTGELSEPDTWTKNVTSYTIEPENDLAPANTSVTITYSSKSTTQAITVENVAVSIVSLKASTTIEKEKTETLIPVFTPANATNKNVTWESDDEDVAAVSDAGVVTAIAAGTANITVTTEDGGKTATCVVTVVNKKGSEDAPYSVSDVEGQETATTFGDNIYVTGYIVGSVKNNKCYKTTTSDLVNTNLLIADTPDKSFSEGASISSNSDGLIPVELPNSGTIRADWGVAANNDLFGYKIIFKGNAESYFGTNAIKGTSEITAITASGIITSCGWSSLASKCPLDLGSISGGTAYYASAASGAVVTLTQCEGEIVSAGEGLMIKDNPGAMFTISVAESGTAISGNKLKGQTATGSISSDPANNKYRYVFGYSNESTYGFYYLNPEGPTTSATIAAGKAYLETTTALTAQNAPAIIRILDEENNATSTERIDGKNDAIKFIENGHIYILREGVVYDALGRIVK